MVSARARIYKSRYGMRCDFFMGVWCVLYKSDIFCASRIVLCRVPANKIDLSGSCMIAMVVHVVSMLILNELMNCFMVAFVKDSRLLAFATAIKDI